MNWKRVAWVPVAAVVALAGAFSAGRFSAPEKVVTKEVEVFKDRVVEKVVTKEVEVVKVVKAKAETKIVYRDRVITPDGTVKEHEEERTETKEDEKTDGERKTDTEKVAERVVEKLVTVEKTVALRPDWRVGVLVGVQWPQPLLPFAGPMVLGVHADRRIVGGLYAGLWAHTGGSFGLGVSFEF